MQAFRTVPLLLAALALPACATLAPRYERARAPIPAALPYVEGAPDSAAALVDWRSVFIDEELRLLIESALANNRDLRVATLNVARARALYRIERSDSAPTVNASADYTRQRFGENATGGVLGAPGAVPEPFTLEQFSASGAVSAYELDLFGRVRSLNKRALEEYFAAEETRKAAEIALVASVAEAYLELAADRELLAIARETEASQRLSLDLTRRLVEGGVGSELDVQRARTSVERARADAAGLEAEVAADENALRLLIGGESAEAPAAAARVGEVAFAAFKPEGVDSSVLLERPDVAAAERSLRAANANIGAARAAFFPQILLTASAGVASAELNDLFSGGTGVWRFAPSVSVPIFTGGRNRAQLKAAKAERDIAAAEYEGAIQTAFREVADALALSETIRERIDATEGLAAAAARAFDLSEMRFENGVDDYLSVLDAQREDYAARRELVLARRDEGASVIALYRALGGGADAPR